MVRLVARNQVFLVRNIIPRLLGGRFSWAGTVGIAGAATRRRVGFVQGQGRGDSARKSIAQIENHGGLARILAARSARFGEAQRVGTICTGVVYFLLTPVGLIDT
jgi:hypothetical protein